MTKKRRTNTAELQRKWDKILAAEGLAPIRGSSNPYVQGSVSHDGTTREAKADYYRIMSGHFHQESFGALRAYKIVMKLHVNGASRTEISRALEVAGLPLERKTVLYVIRRYENKWGVRRWTSRQMRLKEESNE